ncbi:JAB domain-containing protein [Caproicibacterium amylolyticum]|jgi:DNA repair protein RadC|uniref:DNA repair protein RadC n=1 Tax=Caproicibacterium amylolyticum TaxID=2766537 RepID=A0A7G9WKV6_9FIRM|nr:DNA repair protein RadC [Caproicibacterium amylolyticum]MBE6723085.1 DNA repair protein RadC [Oscillospiraceae bacterium]QNO19318.1 DNA repair protein RadC [Caproicibacterium amylolyticum]
MAAKGDNLHNGHRERLRARCRKDGLDSFEEHEVLELLLFYAIPYQDTNLLAHRLLQRFGSLAGVLDAPEEELQKVKGIGENTAFLLKILPSVYRRYQISLQKKVTYIAGETDAADYLQNWFVGRTHEFVLLMLLDARHRLLFCDTVNEGTATTANIYIRKIVQTAVQYEATFAFVAHNHPSGELLPSVQDLHATKLIYDALASVEVQLVDHIIVSQNDYLSLSQSEYFDYAIGLGTASDTERNVADPSTEQE